MTFSQGNGVAHYEQFSALDIRVGTIVRAEPFNEAHKPAYKLWIDFGTAIGERKSSAQITALYSLDDLLNRQVLAVVNFEPKQIGNFMSECLVLGAHTDEGVALLQVDRPCKNGEKIG